MRAIMLSMMCCAGDVLAHPGHGLTGSHPHGWDSVLLVVAIAAAVLLAARR